jgi:subtilisin family serine protease
LAEFDGKLGEQTLLPQVASGTSNLVAQRLFDREMLEQRDDVSKRFMEGQNVRVSPTEPDPLWFHDEDHSRFDAAAGLAGGKRVRVAHFDTGYDPAHRALPRYLNKTLERNFVDGYRVDDASDDTTGPFNNLGHGTGTLGILAGAALFLSS